MANVLSFFLFFLFQGFLRPANGELWSVFVKDRNDKSTNDDIRVDLARITGPGNLWESSSASFGTLFFWADFDKSDKDRASAIKGVRLVTKPLEVPTYTLSQRHEISDNVTSATTLRGRYLQRRDVAVQPGAPRQLRLMSKTPSENVDQTSQYFYDSSAGAGGHIYIVDTGLEKDHPEFKNADIGEWIQGGGDNDGQQNDYHDSNHGTTMASMALGQTCGVAKKAQLHVVRCMQPNMGGAEHFSSPEYQIDGLVKVYESIVKQDANRKGRSVVSMSLGNDGLSGDYQAIIVDLFTLVLGKIMNDAETPVVAAAGNDGRKLPPVVDSFPALLAAPLPGEQEARLPKLVVVGGVTLNGQWDTNTQRSDWVPIYGLSDENCAAVGGGKYSDTVDGTSPATAAAAGLVAYFIGLGMSAMDARQHMLDIAYSENKDKLSNFPPHTSNGETRRPANFLQWINGLGASVKEGSKQS